MKKIIITIILLFTMVVSGFSSDNSNVYFYTTAIDKESRAADLEILPSERYYNEIIVQQNLISFWSNDMNTRGADNDDWLFGDGSDVKTVMPIPAGLYFLLISCMLYAMKIVVLNRRIKK